MPGTYRCDCQPGFRGPFCSDDIDECMLQPCKNRGRCTNEYGSYKCYCPPEYYGALCEKACRPGTCSNDGLCVSEFLNDDTTGWSCVCPEHTFGDKCEYVSPCYYVPCGIANQCIANNTDTEL
jgi:hypothetical protein